MKNNRTKNISIRVRPDILQEADALKQQYNYSRGDIFEMGVLFLESNNDASTIIETKIYYEMINRFDKLNKSVDKACKDIMKAVSSEIESLKEQKKTKFVPVTDVASVNESNLNEAIDKILTIVEIREDNMKYPKHVRKVFEPLGKEYFMKISSDYNIPYESILNKLNEMGYNSDYLLEIGMNPLRNYEGEREVSKSTIM